MDRDWLAEVARRQGGVVTVAQVRRAGVSDSARGRRVRGQVWVRVAPDVVKVSAGEPSRRQVAMAAVLQAGGDAVVTGLTALELAEVPHVAFGDEVHVLVRAGCSGRLMPGVFRERTARLPVALPLRVPPTAPYARAVLDACSRVERDDDARSAALSAVQSGLCGVAELRAESERAPRRRRLRVLRILEELGAGVRSLPEADLRRLVCGAGLPEPLWNARVHLPDGRLLCVPDALWEEERLVVEVDSVAHHGRGEDRVRTAERARRMRAAGLRVFSVLPRTIREDGAAVVGAIAGALAARRPDRGEPRLVVVACRE
ncbi:type IV toxin-antitoxin system AbiEi family antitoxin domain-containing protein [Yinghuangia soli]|uniref:DUF559 domain-containing protein n=1 Tax=Yinghuangia soli TaxID=2908204 RepID=A0AA41PZ90_9ACTN|nr:type IV toxin-antitoxin system AbiEi family antitoxin domain-containing protein [Yinghuangia soli]MCF2528668.1 hypothetical protein [Yinghuangia soli]